MTAPSDGEPDCWVLPCQAAVMVQGRQAAIMKIQQFLDMEKMLWKSLKGKIHAQPLKKIGTEKHT